MKTATQTQTQTKISIDGHAIQYDASGVGHSWLAATVIDCPPDIQEEIAAEIIDGKRPTGRYTATNGVTYRW